MLETALQQERAHSLQTHGAVPQPLLEQQPISQTTTDAIGEQFNPVRGVASEAQLQLLCRLCDRRCPGDVSAKHSGLKVNFLIRLLASQLLGLASFSKKIVNCQLIRWPMVTACRL